MSPLDPRLRAHLKPARLPLAAVVGSGIVGGVLTICQAFAVADLVVTLLSSPGDGEWHRAAWWLAGITLARAAAGAYADLAAARAAGIITRNLRSRLLRAAFNLDAAGLASRPSGELALLGTRGVAAVEPYVTRYLPALVVATVLPPVTLVVIGVLDLWAGLIVALTLPLVPVFAILIGLATRDRAGHQYRTLSVLAGHFVDVVRGLPTLVTFNRAEFQARRIREVTDRYRRATLETLKLAFASSAALELIATLSVALVAVSVGLRLATGGLDFRTALVLLLLAPEAYWPLRRVGVEFHAAAEGVATFTAIDELIADSGPRAVRADLSTDCYRVDPVPIQISDLVTHYPARETPALVLRACTIPATGLTAIVGPSGSGKSTLVQALLGEIVPSSGEITLAGERVDVESWRCLVAQVPQEPWLTGGSVADNLRLGRPGATTEDLWNSLTRVSLDAVVRGLRYGIDTPLGEDGSGLSAGQRARLALARVVVADRPYIFLDEPTAHLDAETEAVMLATLTELAQHATVVVVAHSAAVVRAADVVITLTDRRAAAPTVASLPLSSEVGEATAGGVEVGTGSQTPRKRLVLATALSTLASLSGVALTATAGWLIARSAEHPPVLMLMVAIIGVRTFGLARPVLRYAERLMSHDVALRVLAESRARVYDVLVPLAPARLGRRRGDLLSSVVDDVDAELDGLLRVRVPILTWLGVSTGVTALALVLNPVTVIPLGVLAFGGGGLSLLVAWAGARRVEARFVILRAELSEELTTSLQSARQLVAWQADDVAVGRLDGLSQRLARTGELSARVTATARGALVVLAGLAVIITARVLVPELASGSVSGPVAALLLLTPLALVEAFAGLPDAGALAVRTRAARERLDCLGALKPAVVEPSRPCRVDGSGAITLKDVSVGWGEAPVLKGFDAHVQAGAAIAVIGDSGCGKSTLAALLLRHLAPSAGRYELEERDAAALGSSEVRRHVGLVDDDPYVFASTLRENLRLARPGASDDELLGALTAVGLADWYCRQPAGLSTRLGDGGGGLSGGEKARIGIARALLLDPSVLVLDEPTAHLDSATARAISATLRAARDGRSLVWITHDRTGLDAMDEVWDLSRPGPGPAGVTFAVPPASTGDQDGGHARGNE